MNRLVLIGNGFDFAHGLKTKYEHFIDWYWEQKINEFIHELTDTLQDKLCTFKLSGGKFWGSYIMPILRSYNRPTSKEIIQHIIQDKQHCKVIPCPFFANILYSVETKKWVDIENEYYDLLKKYALEEDGESKVDELNEQLRFLQDKLVDYLKGIELKENIIRKDIRPKIYAPICHSDIAIGGQDALKEHIKEEIKLDNKEQDYKFQQYNSCYSSGFVDDYKKKFSDKRDIDWDSVPQELLLPNQILLLNFNYTKTARFYCKNAPIFNVIQIHGELEHPSSVIFGYGDELDEDYKEIMNKNDNRYLGNIKSVKYLESDNYRKVLSFIEAEPYQILIMGHSCGNSDRTLLNTLFEHKNCVSIKPYYYKDKETGKDNYLELVQNISRNFKDMKLMRDRVVNKTFTEPLTSY